ncbi:o-succinylbenzoate synthase [Zeaxanthinibacter sp. PT1]|uniref:o-succinylbenzoate synthase n=1 Tax=Zeaxanthinibacter TaxID=561554 RepID=UPI00234A568A|nr:o-succinylbenzoate synthase [Zeaxanthinibacter sp. PT1]MDC6351674.1 o-succinylbenzoate synthase [Zeaxanthinibacter sp. PT1]
MKASYHKYILNFKTPGGTSRGVLRQKETWFLILEQDSRLGIGECGLFRGLSADDLPDYADRLRWLCENIESTPEQIRAELWQYPSILFGWEQAMRSLSARHPFHLFPSVFTEEEAPIPINGLIWMGDPDYMQQQIQQKIDQGFRCLKMKIGAIDFESEIALLRGIRNVFPSSELEIRVDANGAFSPDEALQKLDQLAPIEIHSIEQPIRQGQPELMRNICASTPIPVALDEELIGIHLTATKEELLARVKPQYIILKPSLVGGYRSSEEWIKIAAAQGCGWWITSALESNVGLNAIAQWTFTLESDMPQGLGTGSLFTNNFESPLTVSNGCLYYSPEKKWDQTIISRICT